MNIVIYDTTAGWLSFIWRVGAHLFALFGRYDAVIAIDMWERLTSVFNEFPAQSVQSVEYWGHGSRNGALCNHRVAPSTTLMQARRVLRADATWWWRVCSSFASVNGQSFARRCTRDLGCRVYGHTFIVWLWHSGLHVLRPDMEPDWSLEEGTEARGDGVTRENLWSWPWSPNTITFLGRLPKE